MDESKKYLSYDIWIPDNPIIVLGRSCIEENDVKLSAYQNGVPIVRRCGGGGTVLIDNGVIIIDIVFSNNNDKSIKQYFHISNMFIVNSLKRMGINALYEEDNYDLVINNKKFGGVTIYKRKDKILYGASILIEEETISIINKYLYNSKKQPTYRRNRDHNDFLIALGQYSNFNKSHFLNEIENEIIKFKMGEENDRNKNSNNGCK